MEKEKKDEKKEVDNIGTVEAIEITKELEQSYLDYAMSVIVTRALPDVRDGLKPVHRRILYAMNEIGLRHTAKYRKSATVVGEVLGKYHPHGDQAVYDTMVRLAQDFSMRYPMVQGQGNFGSIDGDSAAAMRYTEARMTALTEEMLADIDKNTVNFVENYDGTRKEPTVLPALPPNLLLNGSTGIAVGMATSIPPHNLREVCDAICLLIDNPQATNEEVCAIIKGPDFPTGGFIYNRKDIMHAYATGKGPIVSRGKAEIVEDKKGNFRIIISAIPYQVNKTTLLEKIVELVKLKKLEHIRDIRDESDRDGMRIVIELKAGAIAQTILNRLFKMTDLEKTFHMNMLALVDGLQPQVLSLKSVLEYYIKHRFEVTTRRTQFDLDKAKDRVHILEGLKKALDHIDEIIKTIKSSKDKETAHENLCKKFGFSERQATAILEMRLQTLAGLERKKIEDELKEKLKLIKELEALLASTKKMMNKIREELVAFKEKFGDDRKTKVVVSKPGEWKEEDLIQDEDVLITLTQNGYVKRVDSKTFKSQKRGGQGIVGMSTREGDVINQCIYASTFDFILFFTNKGRVFKTKCYEIPESSRTAKGNAIVNLLPLTQDEKVTVALKLEKDAKDVKYLAMTTRSGMIKKTPLDDFENVRRSGLIALTLSKGDELEWALPTSGSNEIMLITAKGQGIKFKEKDVRPMGRTAAGVRGIKIKGDDHVVDMIVVSAEDKSSNVLMVTQNGYGKRTAVKNFKTQNRGGSGMKAGKITKKTGDVIATRMIYPEYTDLMVISEKAQIIRIPINSVPVLGRVTQGVRIMKLKGGDAIASIACSSEEIEEIKAENQLN